MDKVKAIMKRCEEDCYVNHFGYRVIELQHLEQILTEQLGRGYVDIGIGSKRGTNATEPAPQDNKCPITGYEAFAELKPAPQEDECPSCGGVGKKYTIDCFTHIRELETCGRCLGTGIDKDWETWHETQITKRKIEECMNSRGDELIDSVEWLTIMDWLDKDGE